MVMGENVSSSFSASKLNRLFYFKASQISSRTNLIIDQIFSILAVGQVLGFLFFVFFCFFFLLFILRYF